MSILSGVKILDFSTLLPGPYASKMLADMGAEVLRVESPTRPDLVKSMEPKVDGVSVVHSYLNRNKNTLTLDLKQPESIEKIQSLVTEYDIVLEQFRPGVMARLGLDYQSLSKLNPQLIYCSITGYGQTGPYKDRAGHDINYLALAGVSDYSRRKGEAPVPSGVQIADVAGGSHHAVMGILAAVIQRQSKSIGQYIDISMSDCAFALNAMCGAQSIAGQLETTAESNLLNGGSFYDYYETSDGRYMSVGSLEPKFLSILIETLNLQDYQSWLMSRDAEKQKAFKEKVIEAFKQETFEHWCTVFSKTDACVEPVLSLKEASEHEVIKQREMIVEVDGQPQLACPIKFQGQELNYRKEKALD